MREWAGPLAGSFRRRDPHLPQKAAYRTPRRNGVGVRKGLERWGVFYGSVCLLSGLSHSEAHGLYGLLLVAWA
jgi:hypothetical protein